MEAYVYNNEGFHTSTKLDLPDDYELQENETFVALNEDDFYKAKFENGVWIEGMPEQEVKEIKIIDLQNKLDDEVENLGEGAVRVASEKSGEGYKGEINKQIYKWSKGNLEHLDDYYAIKYGIEQNQKEASKRVDFKTWKLSIKLRGDKINASIQMFYVFIDIAKDQAQKYIDSEEIEKAESVLELMESVEDDITTEEAAIILNQILSI